MISFLSLQSKQTRKARRCAREHMCCATDAKVQLIQLMHFPAVLCTMGKPLFPLRPSGAQKPLSDGSDGDIRGGTLQQNQGHLDMPTESFSCTQEKTIFEDQKIAQGRVGWEPETFLEPAFGKSVTAQVSCAGADAPRGLGGNANSGN